MPIRIQRGQNVRPPGTSDGFPAGSSSNELSIVFIYASVRIIVVAPRCHFCRALQLPSRLQPAHR